MTDVMRLKTCLFSLVYGVVWEYWGHIVVYGLCCMLLIVSMSFYLFIVAFMLFNNVYTL